MNSPRVGDRIQLTEQQDDPDPIEPDAMEMDTDVTRRSDGCEM